MECTTGAAAPGRGPRVAMVVEQLWQSVPGGSGTYIVELARALRGRGARLAGLAARHGASPSPAELGLPDMPLRFAHLPRPALYESWNRLGLPRAESTLPGAEVVHATTWAIPGTRLPLVVTVHDVAFLRSPEHFTRRGNAYFATALERTRREADAVVVPSTATADDCVAAGLDAGRIHVIPHGVRTRAVGPGPPTAWSASTSCGPARASPARTCPSSCAPSPSWRRSARISISYWSAPPAGATTPRSGP